MVKSGKIEMEERKIKFSLIRNELVKSIIKMKYQEKGDYQK